MFSESPGTPARTPQMPRTTMSIRVPAALAAYSASMTSGSCTAFSFSVMRPSAPNVASWFTSLMISRFNWCGATMSCWYSGSRPYPVR